MRKPLIIWLIPLQTDADGIALSKALSDGKYIVKEKLLNQAIR